jgi:PAS domain S-box-containing protein
MAAIRGPQGDVTAVATIERDVTERVEAEQKLQQIHEQLELATRSAGIGTWDVNVPAGTSRWNDQLYQLLGLEPRPDTEEQVETFFRNIHPADRENGRSNLNAVISTDGEDLNDEFRIVRADGTTRWLASQGRVYRDATGRVIRMAGVNYDITDIKASEAAMAAAQKELAEKLAELTRVNQELSEYAYAVSHDLKAPLRAIRNYADFLIADLAENLDGDAKRYLEGLKKAVSQGEQLINDLLVYSRIGRVPVESEPIDIPQLLKEIRSFLRLSSDVEMITADNWPVIEADRTLLKQIFQNLISNAVKFNDLNQKRVEVGWQDGTEDRIDIFVRDNGIGIKPQYTEQIFRVFQRLHTQKAYEATGIGLAVVKKAAAHLDGKVRLESTPGEGSTFFVEIPRKMEIKN